jgi:hypothetical protein
MNLVSALTLPALAFAIFSFVGRGNTASVSLKGDSGKSSVAFSAGARDRAAKLCAA